MRTEDIPEKAASPWVPEKNLETLALLLKLAEENCELAARCCRAAMQGFSEADPDDGRTNAEHTWDEIADVEAMIAHMKERRADALDRTAIERRRCRKFAFKLPWFNFLKSRTSGQ